MAGELDFLFGGSKDAARAAEAAALEQARVAQEQLDFAKQTQERAVAAAESPEEIRALERSLEMQERSFKEQAKLLDALDPAIMEASNQALKLLRGEESRFLDPIRRQRQRQRQSLLNSLREQLGPGAETSTAGIQALTQFDAETDTLISGAQQQGLSQVFELAQGGLQTRGARAQGLSGVAQGVGQVGQAFGNIASREVGAITNTTPFISQAFDAKRGSAGAQFTAEALIGQAKQGLINRGIEGAFELGSSAFSGGMPSSKGTSASSVELDKTMASNPRIF